MHTTSLDNAANPASVPAPKHLHGPWADALLLGGASIMAFVLLRAISPNGAQVAALAVLAMVLANFVNHPHFAHSYQMFYGSWREIRSDAFPSHLRVRWYLAGIYLPAALVLWLAFSAWRWTQGESWLMASSLNLMGALVGWHYVKQGFGMAMMDAALKKNYWTPEARKAMLWNAYACWLAAWALINTSHAGSAFWGFFGLKLDIPGYAVALACVPAMATTVWASLAIVNSLARLPYRWGDLPLSGVLAYYVTLYLWTIFSWVDAAYMLLIPFFHSLQYLTVVWRYKKNELGCLREAANKTISDLVRFWANGVLLGALGFWLLPAGIDYVASGHLPFISSGPALALAVFWIFINVHHYLIDNVLWRQGNPKVNQYLFLAAKK
jgi:hypothetical protein